MPFVVFGNKYDVDSAVSESRLRDALGLSFRTSALCQRQRAHGPTGIIDQRVRFSRSQPPHRRVHVLRDQAVRVRGGARLGLQVSLAPSAKFYCELEQKEQCPSWPAS